MKRLNMINISPSIPHCISNRLLETLPAKHDILRFLIQDMKCQFITITLALFIPGIYTSNNTVYGYLHELLPQLGVPAYTADQRIQVANAIKTMFKVLYIN